MENKMSQGTLQRIQEIVDFCKKRVLFYAEKLKDINVRSVSDFEKIPIISKDDYIPNTPPNSSKMLSGKSDKCFLFSTGGTTSNPKYVVRDFKDFESQCMDYIGLDVNKNDTVINLFMPGIWGIFTSANITLMKLGCKIIPYGGSNLNDESYKAIVKLIEDFNVNFLIGVPSTIISVISHLKKENKLEAIKKINKIFCLGEMVTESMMDYFKSNLPSARVKSKYGLMESAGIGYQCKYIGGNNYHVFPDRYVEIIKDSSRAKEGSVVVTTLNKRLVPLLRYKTGDVGTLRNTKCKCGAKYILQINGRGDDEVIFASIHLSINFISAVIDRIGGGCSQIFQIILTKKNELDLIEVKIESEIPIEKAEISKITDKLFEEFCKEIPDILDAIKSRKIEGFLINIVNPGNISRLGSSGKIKKIIDLRK